MEEIVSLPPMEFFNDDFQMVLDFIESLGNPKYKIAGNVNLMFNGKITSLGNLIEIGGDLLLLYSKITSLPDNLWVNGNLDLGNTEISHLPKNLHVDGSLILENSFIKQLPDNLYVGHDLNASFLEIDSIPNNLYVGNELGLFMTPITKKYFGLEIKDMIIEKGGYVGSHIA